VRVNFGQEPFLFDFTTLLPPGYLTSLEAGGSGADHKKTAGKHWGVALLLFLGLY